MRKEKEQQNQIENRKSKRNEFEIEREEKCRAQFSRTQANCYL